MELVGLAEIAELLSVGRARADQLARQKGFPEPVQVISAGRIWRLADIEEWARERGRTLRPHD
jgi:predicted DNA-binding transcriptional regulator AlpA